MKKKCMALVVLGTMSNFSFSTSGGLGNAKHFPVCLCYAPNACLHNGIYSMDV
ncbi:MAG: hypothetical protein RR768_05655 [Clostridium sp.]